MAARGHHREDHRDHLQVDEADSPAMVSQVELEGEVFLAFVSDTAAWAKELRSKDAPPVRRVIDIGSGPGVGACELARLFPEAHIVAVDRSPAMLDRTTRRANAHGLQARISTHLAELPDGLDGFERADVIWASMSLHHIGDEVGALCVLHDVLDHHGLVAIAEIDEPTRVLPDDLDLGRPGLAERLDNAGARWFAAMREGLTGSVPSTDLASMLRAAGFDVVGSRVARERFDRPLSDDARRVALGHIRSMRERLDDYLDPEDLRTLDVLSDANDERSVIHRSDVYLVSSRQIVVARPAGGQ